MFAGLGHTLKDAALPEWQWPEAVTAAETKAFHGPLAAARRQFYDPAILGMIDGVNSPDSAAVAREMERLSKDRLLISASLFKDVDLLILPTTLTTTPAIAQAAAQGPFALDDANTSPFNYFGLPAISIPCGFDHRGMPLGLQIAGPRYGERAVLSAAYQFQQATPWHLKSPSLSFLR